MRILRLAAVLLFALGAARAQTTNVTATLQDPSGTIWANATWTATVISSLNPPVTLPGYNTFTTTYSGTANASGFFSVTVQSVANIFPANSTWQFCVVSGVSFTEQFCVKVPVGNTGQTNQDVSTQINAALTNPVVNGGFQVRGYNDAEITGFPGAMYYNIVSNTFRCFTLTWGPCSVGSGATTPATSLVLKGGGSTNSVLPAVPGTDYVIPSGSITGTAGNLSGAPLLPSGTTALTQVPGDASALLATDAFVNRAFSGIIPATTLLLKGNGANGVVPAVPGTDYLVPLASANVLGSTSGGVLQAATSGQIVAALNTSPTATLSTVLFPFYAQPGDTIASIESQCSAVCTYIVAIPQTFSLTSNHTLSSNVNPVFLAAGKWTVNSFALTIPGHVDGTLTTHFAGSGSVKFGSQQPLVPVEWFGAVPDWNGTTGTNNLTAIQAALNSVGAGQVLLQAAKYAISGTLSIGSSNVGIEGTVPGGVVAAAVTTPSSSVIINTSASADTVDVAGSSASARVLYNAFDHVALERSVAPSTNTIAGLSLNYAAGTIIEYVQSMDSARNFYYHSAPSFGIGITDHTWASWGYNGVTEGSANPLVGYYVDSADGQAENSLTIDESVATSSLSSAVTTYGLYVQGSAVNDLDTYYFGSGTTSYGIYIDYNGPNSGIGSQDLHFINSTLDGCYISCIFVEGLMPGARASADFDGGWANAQSSSATIPTIQLFLTSGVSIRGMQISNNNATSPGIIFNQANSSLAVDNRFVGTMGNDVLLESGSYNVVKGNSMTNTSTAAISAINASLHNVILGNMIGGDGGTIPTGINFDSSSQFNIGTTYDNAFSPTVTTPIVDPSGLNGGFFTANNLKGSGSPTVAVQTAAGSGATASLVTGSTDFTGAITLTTGTGPSASSSLVHLTFSVARPTTPVFTITPANAAAAGINVWTNVVSDGVVSLDSGTSAPAASTTYVWNYVITGLSQ